MFFEACSERLASLPIELLTDVHTWLLNADPTLRSCLALEATCKYLRSLLCSITRFKQVTVTGPALTTVPSSFCRWIAAHGCRTDKLVVEDLGLCHTTPKLCSLPGVLQAKHVHVCAAVIDTLEPLGGLINLTSVTYDGPEVQHSAVSLEPLADLPALEHVNLDSAIMFTPSLAPLCTVATLQTLHIYSAAVRELGEVGGLTTQLQKLELVGFDGVTSLVPLSCLTSLTHLSLFGFATAGTLAPLRALSRLHTLELSILASRSIDLQPICQLASLRTLGLTADRPDLITEYDLQPLSALSRTLHLLIIQDCFLRNMCSIVDMTGLGQLVLEGCRQPEGHASLVLGTLPQLTYLSVSDATVDLDSIGLLTSLDSLHIGHATNLTSLDPLSPLTNLKDLRLESCSSISSLDPLSALQGLDCLELAACPNLSSLSVLTALPALAELTLEGCQHLAATLPTSLLPGLEVFSHD